MVDPTEDYCTECHSEEADFGSDWCRSCIREAKELERLDLDRDEN